MSRLGFGQSSPEPMPPGDGPRFRLALGMSGRRRGATCASGRRETGVGRAFFLPPRGTAPRRAGLGHEQFLAAVPEGPDYDPGGAHCSNGTCAGTTANSNTTSSPWTRRHRRGLAATRHLLDLGRCMAVAVVVASPTSSQWRPRRRLLLHAPVRRGARRRRAYAPTLQTDRAVPEPRPAHPRCVRAPRGSGVR